MRRADPSLWAFVILVGCGAALKGEDFPPEVQEKAASAVEAAQGSRVGDAAPLTPDESTVSAGKPGEAAVRVLIEQSGRRLPVPGVTFRAEIAGKPAPAATDDSGGAAFPGCAPGESVDLVGALASDDFSIAPEGRFKLAARVPCGAQISLVFKKRNPRLIVLRVWRVATLAKAKLDDQIGPSAWPKVGFSLAYSGGDATSKHGHILVSANNTTFAIGHELGHVIAEHEGMMRGGFDDTNHQMFACIDEASALEEGWASFFAAWVDDDLDAVDPVEEWDDRPNPADRLSLKSLPETLQIGPADQRQRAQVCHGPGNEMRVSSFLWNLVDQKTPPGALQVPFPVLWKALRGQDLRSAEQATARLESLGVDRAKLQEIWTAAFETPYPAASSR